MKVFQYKNNIVFEFKFNYALKDKVKSLFEGAMRFNQFKKHPNTWSVSLTYVSHPQSRVEKLLSFCKEEGFEIEDNLIEHLKNSVEVQKELSVLSKSLDEDFSVDGLLLTPRPYQQAGIKYMVKTQRCLNGDSVRLGKTLQTLAAIHYQKAYPSLIICKSSLMYNWKYEIAKTLGNENCYIIEKISKGIEPQKDFIIINPEKLDKLKSKLLEYDFKSIVFDEAHNCGRANTLKFKALQEISKKIPVRYALSGTPIRNKAHEITQILSFLGRLSEFGGKWGLINEHYHVGYNFEIGAAKDLDKLHDKLKSTCLTYDTLVSCKESDIPIGHIVENKMPVEVWSKDIDGNIVLRKAVAFSKRATPKFMVKISSGHKSVCCTPDHEIWTEGGYVRADTLRSGDYVLELCEKGSEKMAHLSNTSKILWYFLQRVIYGQNSCGSSQAEHCKEETSWKKYCNYLRSVWKEEVLSQSKIKSAKKILWGSLQCFLEADPATCTRHPEKDARSCGKMERYRGGYSPYEATRRRHETEAHRYKNAISCQKEDQQLPTSKEDKAQVTKEFKDFKTCCCASKSDAIPEKISRIPYTITKTSKIFSEASSLFVHSFGASRIQNSNRGGWAFAQGGETAEDRSVEGKKAAFVRVESVEVYEQTDRNRFESGDGHNSFVYDIEVEDTHNFFANEVLVSNCMVRRTKEEVLNEVPSKSFYSVEVPLSNRAHYDSLTDEIRSLRTKAAKDLVYRAERKGKIFELRKILGVGKVEAIVDWIHDFLEQTNESIIVFAHHIDVQQALIAAFPDAAKVLGSSSATLAENNQNKEDFQSKKKRILIGSLLVAGEGLDLSVANTMVFCELGWTPVQMEQALGRMEAVGKTDPLTVYTFIGENTIDIKLAGMLKEKGFEADMVASGKVSEDGYTERLLEDL